VKEFGPSPAAVPAPARACAWPTTMKTVMAVTTITMIREALVKDASTPPICSETIGLMANVRAVNDLRPRLRPCLRPNTRPATWN